MKEYFIFMLMVMICGCTAWIESDSVKLQGKWEQELRHDVIYMAGQKHIFEFKNDSFKVSIFSWTDVDEYKLWDPCYHTNHIEYAAGRFKLDDEKIYFNGIYTDSIYNVIKVGCFNVGKFEKSYSGKIYNDSAYFIIDTGDIYNDFVTEIILKKINE